MLESMELPTARRADALREMPAPLRSAVPMPGDGYDLHRQGGGFPVESDDPRLTDALRRLVAQDVRGRIERALTAAWGRLQATTPGIEAPGTPCR